jgi:hypothetical protein
MLTHRGIAPGKVWWSRVLTFGFAYAIYCVPLVMIFINVAFSGNSDYFRFYLCNEPNFYDGLFRSDGQWRPENITAGWQCFYVAITLFAAIFCMGQMISLFMRSFIAAIPVVLAMFIGLFFWVMIVKYLLGYGGLVWAVWPILLACLVASRIRTANWQRGRNTWRAWRPPVLTLVAPTLLILCVIPIVRVYSVPVIYLGYMVDSSMMRHPRFSQEQEYLAVDDGASSYWSIPHNEVWQRLQESERNNHYTIDTARYAMAYYGYYDNWILYQQWLGRVAGAKDVTPETLRQLVALLERTAQNRPPLRKVVMDSYIAEYQTAAFHSQNIADFFVRVGMPWEKYRIMRRLDYEFQVQSQLADEMEQVIYHNHGSYGMVERKAEALSHHRQMQYCEIFQENLGLISWRFSSLNYPNQYLRHETRYRALILQVALQAYYLEHGALPETLAELEGDYVTQLPTVPITGKAFEYKPQPAPDELVGGWEGDGKETYRGVPYLHVPRDANVGHSSYYHLEFMKGKTVTP